MAMLDRLATPDYPAAHSMDTRWFAIDQDGRVGIFDTGEDGALPIHALSLGGAGAPDAQATRALELLTADADEDARADMIWERGGPFFHYANDDYGNPGAYARGEQVPEVPADVAALPAELRAAMLRLPVDFRRDRALHLADFMADAEVHTWAETTLRGEPLGPERPVRPASAGERGWLGWVLLVIAAVIALLWAAG